MTHRTLDHEERLRHALRAAAESVEPEGDGLERIRARITTPRPAPAAWMATEPTGLRMGPALRSFRNSRAVRWLFPTADGSPSPYRWLRPVAAMAAFVLIIGSGALALTTGSTSVLTASGSSKTGDGLHISKGSSGQPAGQGRQVGSSPSTGSPTAPTPAPTSSSSQSQAANPTPSPSSGNCTTPPPSAKGGGPPSATPTPTESPSPTTSPDPSATPTPSSTPTTSSGTTTPPTTPSASSGSSATLDAATAPTASATPTSTPKKHHPHPTC